MDHYARGDSQKISSSEDDEGYENQAPAARISESDLQLNLRDKRYFAMGVFEQSLPTPVPPLSDDTDRPFWAEDELSNSESKQRLNDRQKRRHSLSYRNRIAIHRSRSLLFQSSSSSSGSTRIKILLTARKREKCNKAGGQFGVTRLETRKIPTHPCGKKDQTFRQTNVKNICSGCQSSSSQQTQPNARVSTSKKLIEIRQNNVSTLFSGNGCEKRSERHRVPKK